MKHIFKYKSLIITAVIIFSIGFYNVTTLREVSKLEKKLGLIKAELEDTEKELDKKIIYYDQKLNLSKIRQNMEKKGMKVANDIIYFEIEDKK
ncbi:hypothetical protein [Fusobacterium russii]|uniref:hypothetical protein n=1 Tax=Fusobacterium russii TaxID=854 RepID=UPI0003A49D5F|nr:hypothetical protein [Fusobacterium russii]